MTDLASRTCVPCRGGVPPLQGEQLATLLAQLSGHWEAIDGHHLRGEYSFPDFLITSYKEATIIKRCSSRRATMSITWIT